MIALPERAATEAPGEAPAVIETFTPQTLLDLAREQAGVLDPRHRSLYADLPAERFHHAADLLSQLILAHQTFLDWHRSREHTATVRRLVLSTNTGELTAALAWSHLAFRTLTARRPDFGLSRSRSTRQTTELPCAAEWPRLPGFDPSRYLEPTLTLSRTHTGSGRQKIEQHLVAPAHGDGENGLPTDHGAIPGDASGEITPKISQRTAGTPNQPTRQPTEQTNLTTTQTTEQTNPSPHPLPHTYLSITTISYLLLITVSLCPLPHCSLALACLPAAPLSCPSRLLLVA